jgi:hypothetical protein
MDEDEEEALHGAAAGNEEDTRTITTVAKKSLPDMM